MAFSDNSILHDSIGQAKYIKSTINTSFALDAVSGHVGSRVQLTSVNNSKGQQWFFTEAGYVQSALKAADGSDLVLDVININGVPASGAKLQICSKNGTIGQKWTLNEGILKSTLNGYVLDGPFSLADGKPLEPQLFPSNDSITQMWIVDIDGLIGQAKYIKSHINANFALDAVSGHTGSRVQLTSLNNSKGQQWFFTEAGYVQSALKAADGSDLVLDVININGVPASGAKLQICSKNGTIGQKWTLNEGILKSTLNGYVLDGPFSLADGKPLEPHLFPSNDSITQMWTVL